MRLGASRSLLATLIALLVSAPLSHAAVSPCDPSRRCHPGEGGWQEVAIQQDDPASERRSIWERGGERVICIDPGPPHCASFGGDLAAFRADAEREANARATLRAEDAARQRAATAAAEAGRSCSPACGDRLMAQGYREIARCDDGHQWSYLLEKGNDMRYCRGINALSGPIESPCTAFTGKLAGFRRMAAAASNCWNQPWQADKTSGN